MVLFWYPEDRRLAEADGEDRLDEVRHWAGRPGDDGGAARRSVSAGSALAKEVIPSCVNACLSGEVLSRGYFRGDAVDGGVTLLVAAEESLWLDGSMADSSFELD